MIDPKQLKNFCRAGMATLLIKTPSVDEELVIHEIVQTLQQKSFFDRALQWDAANQFKTIELNGKTDTEAPLDVSPQAHPVLTFFHHLEAKLELNYPTLVIAKDIWKFIESPEARPDFIRLAIDCFYRLKRSHHRLFILDVTGNIPAHFQDLVWLLPNPLPNSDEISALIDRKMQSLAQSARYARIEFPISLTSSDWQQLIRTCQGLTSEAIEDILQLVALEKSSFTSDALEPVKALKVQRLANSGITFGNPPDVAVKGLSAVQAWASSQLPLLLDPVGRSQYNLQLTKGVLVVGPAGTGKSLFAKTLAQQWNIPLLQLDMGRLMNKHLGGSEANLRGLLEIAEACAPCILWADEIDKQLASTHGENDGGTSARAIAFLLTWLQEHKSDVILVATANRPWNLTAEQLRRFQCFFVDLPDVNARLEIWEALLEKFSISLPTEAVELLAAESEYHTGAEINTIVSECAVNAWVEKHPGQVDVGVLLNKLRCRHPQWGGRNQELLELRNWAASSQAIWANPSTQSSSTTQNSRHINW
ncbi:MAG: AAA family ATPase [Chroococcales cyanobacterium]